MYRHRDSKRHRTLTSGSFKSHDITDASPNSFATMTNEIINDLPETSIVEYSRSHEGDDPCELSFRHIFGSRSGPASSVWFSKEDELVYPVGRQVAFQNIDSTIMSVLPQKRVHCQPVTALCMSADRKMLVVCQRGQHGLARKPTTVICSLPSFEVAWRLTHPARTTISAVAISHDTRFVAFVSGAPVHALSVYRWETRKLVAQKELGTQIERVSFSPNDHSVLCASGEKYLRILKYVGNNLGELALLAVVKESAHSFVDHVWLSPERLVATTEGCHVFYFYRQQLEQTIVCSGKQQGSRAMNFGDLGAVLRQTTQNVCLARFARGFLLGTRAGGVHLYEQSRTSGLYQMAKTFETGAGCAVQHLAVSPGKSVFVACLEKNSDLLLMRTTSMDVAQDSDLKFERLMQYTGHVGAITAMDICELQGLVATCGADKTVRVWDPKTRKCKLQREFSEVPTCISFHPQGFQLVVGFLDNVIMLHLLHASLQLSHEMSLRKSLKIAYSHGGHLIAVARGTGIIILSSVTFTLVSHINSHSGTIRSMRWSQDDSVIASVATDGAVYAYNLKGERMHEIILRGTTCNDLVMNWEAKEFAVSTDTKRLYMLPENMEHKHEIDLKVDLYSIVFLSY
eukprot:57903_1